MRLAAAPFDNISSGLDFSLGRVGYYRELSANTTYKPVVKSIFDELPGQSNEKLVYSVLDNAKSDFISIDEIIKHTDLSRESVLSALEGLGNKVRRPLFTRANEEELYRATSRGNTRREKYRLIFDMVSRG